MSSAQRALFTEMQHSWDGNDILPGVTALSYSLVFPMTESISLWLVHLLQVQNQAHSFKNHPYLEEKTTTQVFMSRNSLPLSVMSYTIWSFTYTLIHNASISLYTHDTTHCTIWACGSLAVVCKYTGHQGCYQHDSWHAAAVLSGLPCGCSSHTLQLEMPHEYSAFPDWSTSINYAKVYTRYLLDKQNHYYCLE